MGVQGLWNVRGIPNNPYNPSENAYSFCILRANSGPLFTSPFTKDSFQINMTGVVTVLELMLIFGFIMQTPLEKAKIPS
jgi:hypothetical protein